MVSSAFVETVMAKMAPVQSVTSFAEEIQLTTVEDWCRILSMQFAQ